MLTVRRNHMVFENENNWYLQEVVQESFLLNLLWSRFIKNEHKMSPSAKFRRKRISLRLAVSCLVEGYRIFG
jgi:hypothetical protein